MERFQGNRIILRGVGFYPSFKPYDFNRRNEA